MAGTFHLFAPNFVSFLDFCFVGIFCHYASLILQMEISSMFYVVYVSPSKFICSLLAPFSAILLVWSFWLPCVLLYYGICYLLGHICTLSL
jgi:hypothetical protein